MATLETPNASAMNGNPASPVPLDTIPISPTKDGESDNYGSNDATTSKGKSSDEPVTVFHDKDNFNVKHPLMNEWTLWFTKPPSGKVCANIPVTLVTILTAIQDHNWNDLLKEVVTFDSVEEFWGIYVCAVPPPLQDFPA